MNGGDDWVVDREPDSGPFGPIGASTLKTMCRFAFKNNPGSAATTDPHQGSFGSIGGCGPNFSLLFAPEERIPKEFWIKVMHTLADGAAKRVHRFSPIPTLLPCASSPH
jgi:hypothetical protein